MDPRQLLFKIVEGVEKGLITPESVSLGGALETQIAREFIYLVREQSAFLARITVKPVGKVQASFKLLDIASEVLVRVAQGTEPTADQLAELARTDVNFVNLATQLFYTLSFDDIRDNKDNPAFEGEIETNMAMTFSNDVVRLGFNGVADDYAGSAWNRLNKGWLQCAKENVPPAQRVNSNGETSLIAVMDAMIAALPDKWADQTKVEFLLSPTDYRAWVKEMYGDGHDVLALAKIDGKLPAYMGFKVASDPNMVTGVQLLTNPKNLWMTVLTSIERYREVSGRKRCLDYTYDYAFDFGVGIAEACVIAWDQGY